MNCLFKIKLLYIMTLYRKYYETEYEIKVRIRTNYTLFKNYHNILTSIAFILSWKNDPK